MYCAELRLRERLFRDQVDLWPRMRGEQTIYYHAVSKQTRRGVTRDRLIIIICSLVIAASLSSLVLYLRSQRPKEFRGDWQCLQCQHIFSSKTFHPGPIDCPKGPGQAVRLVRKICPQCGKKVLAFRSRLTEQAQAIHQSILAQREAGTFKGIYAMAVSELPMEVQYWRKGPDGRYGWTDQWYPAISPADAQAQADLQCSECDAKLYPLNR